MILVIPTGNQDEDRMLECEAHALQRKYFSKKTRDKYGISFFQPKRGILYVANDKQLPLLDLASGEKLYIVGHTVINNYEMTLSGMTPEQLASCLMNSGLNIHQRGLKLNLIGCRAGKKLHPLKGSYAWQLWNHLVVHLNEIDFRFRAAEICSLPTIKAPKTAIRFDGRGESYVIPEKVDKAYLEILNSGRV